MKSVLAQDWSGQLMPDCAARCGGWPRDLIPALPGVARGASFRADPQSARLAREFTRSVLAGWGLAGDLVDDVTLVASELVANAVEHGCGPAGPADDQPDVELSLHLDHRQLVCVVIDSGSRSPVLQGANLAAESGWGLRAVQAITGTWGWTRLTTDRKAVWAAVAIRDAR